MGTLYKFTNAKLTKNDVLVRQGVFYGWGASYEDSYAKNEASFSQTLEAAHMDNKLIGLNSKVAGFGFDFDVSIPADYPQYSPYFKAGISNPVYKNDILLQDTFYKFFPNANDGSFYIKIRLSKPRGQNGGSVNMWLCRPSIGLEWWLCDLSPSTGFYTGTAVGAVGQVGAVFLPWKPTNQDGYATRGNTYAIVMEKYDFVGPNQGTLDDIHLYSTQFYTNYLGRENYEGVWNQFTGDYEPEIFDTDNPYAGGGTSTEGGGDGNFSDDSDDVSIDNLPTVDALGSGMATLFTPTGTQLRHLADVMWNSNFFTFMQNLVENISDMFTSLAIVPFTVPNGQTVSVTWLGFDTAVSLTLALKQFLEFDMGSINLANDERIFTSGSALDYSPYSRLGIFLPFIGFQELDVDECRGAVLHLKYRIDILSGTCVALISVDGNTIYQFTGNCLSQIPITNENMQSLVSDAVNVGIAACATHSAAGAASADMAAANDSKGISEGARDAKIAHAQAHVASSAGQLSSATANAAMGMKPTFGKAGAISASASLLAVKQPYLFLTTPRQSIPDHYQRYCGFPSNISGKLNTFRGFTVIEDIRLNGLVATSSEVSEIYDLLKKGVII